MDQKNRVGCPVFLIMASGITLIPILLSLRFPDFHRQNKHIQVEPWPERVRHLYLIRIIVAISILKNLNLLFRYKLPRRDGL